MSLSPDYKTDFVAGTKIKSEEVNKNFQLIEQGNSFDASAIRNDSIDDNTVTLIKLNEDVTSFFENIDNKGQPDGYCPLDASGNIPAGYIPEVIALDILDHGTRVVKDAQELDLARGLQTVATDIRATTQVNEAEFDSAFIPFIASGDVTATNIQDAINELDTEKLARDGSQEMQGNLNLNDYHIINLTDPSNNQDADTKAARNAAIALLKLNGLGTLADDNIDANANRIINVVDPSGDQDAATKFYVDNLIPKLTETERDSLTPVEPNLIYNTDAHKFQWWDGLDWQSI